MVAAQCGHEGVCRLLIANRASIEAKNGFRMTPLIWAAKNGHEGVCKLLIENKASLVRMPATSSPISIFVRSPNPKHCPSIPESLSSPNLKTS